MEGLDGEENGRPLLSEEGEKELTKLWRTWKTVNEMLLDRVRLWQVPSSWEASADLVVRLGIRNFQRRDQYFTGDIPTPVWRARFWLR